MNEKKVKRIGKGKPERNEKPDPTVWLSCAWSEAKAIYEIDLQDGRYPADPAIIEGYLKMLNAYVRRYFEMPPIVEKEYKEIMLDFQVAISNFLGSVKFRGGRILK